jgi:phosphoribosylformylglycinamidine cyclo-ligase
VNITGHGWRKLMRAPENFVYVIDELPHEQQLFRFMQERGPIDDREAFGNLNMGAGLALYVDPANVSKVAHVLITGWGGAHYPHIELDLEVAGHIEESDTKKVVILPKKLEYGGEELQVR